MEENRITIEDAIEVLKINLEVIDRVHEWSQLMGYSKPQTFSKDFRNQFEMRPKKVMIRVKTDVAIKLLSENTNISCYQVAKKIGKKDEHALFQFMKKETGYPPSWFFNNKNT